VKLELTAAQIELLCQVVHDAMRRAQANYENATANLRFRPESVRMRKSYFEAIAALNDAMPSVLYGD